MRFYTNSHRHYCGIDLHARSMYVCIIDSLGKALLRGRNYLTRKRADLPGHIQNTNSQYNMKPFAKKTTYKSNRNGVSEQFVDPDVRMSVSIDLGP